MDAYYDTSCIAKLYVPETKSARVIKRVMDEGKALIYTPLHDTELRNAIALKVFRGDISRDEMSAVFLKIESDMKAGRLMRLPADW